MSSACESPARGAAADGAAPEGLHPHRVSPWFAIAGVMLMVTVLAAVFVQARQFAMLEQAVKNQNDYLAISLYQLETEFLRLRELLAQPEEADSATLQLRYDIFVSRLSLLNTERAQRLLSASPLAPQVMSALEAFTRRADLYIGPKPQGALSPQAMAVLLAELRGLDGPIHRMLLDASHHVAEQMTDRQLQLQQHNRVGLGLTGFLVCVVLLFASLALRQMRQAGQRQQRLQRLADQLRDARIEAESASEAKSDFLADMSHELRTPLHGLLGMLSLARDDPQDRRAEQWLQTADESAHHLLRLLDDMLDLSKLEAGTMTLNPRPVTLPVLLGEVRALMLPAAQDKGLALQVDVAHDLPAHVALDATRVKQVLLNLLSNAVKFSEAGAIALRCRKVPRGQPAAREEATAAGQGEPDWLEFAVSDTGIGMDADTVSRLFQRYTRADDPRARAQGGTGLGLAISRNLAALMGGEIQVASTPGAGSVFTFRCPMVPAEAPPPAQIGDAARTSGSLSVLVAEDHPVNRIYMAALLERLGHAAHLVDNGLEALSAAQQRHYDLVLMDVHMPLMDGVSATRAIRALPGQAGDTCIVALTADVFGDTRDRCLAAGAAEVVTKPVSLPMLQTLLDRHFGRAEPPGCRETPREPAGTAADMAGPSDPAHAAPRGLVRLLDTETVQRVRDLMSPSTMPSLYESFFDQARQAAQGMRKAMREADAEALRAQAHAVKGAALNLGLTGLAEAAARLSRGAAHLPAAELALEVQRYEEMAGATERACHQHGLITG